MQQPHLLALLSEIEAAAREAGAVALGHFRKGEKTAAQIHYKHGGSPVTEADHAANAILLQRLHMSHPETGWLSEETEDTDERLTREAVFIVDPIDGTRAFIAGEANWTVCVALVVAGVPVAGVVFAPALDLVLSAAQGCGAHANGRMLTAIAEPTGAFRVTGPKPMIDWLAPRIGPLIRLPRVASLAFRLAGVAIGEADLALASDNAHDWDIAASDIILREAGCALTGLHGEKPVYNRLDPVHPALIAGSDAVCQRVVAAAAGVRRLP